MPYFDIEAQTREWTDEDRSQALQAVEEERARELFIPEDYVELYLQRRERRIKAGHLTSCMECGKALTAEDPGIVKGRMKNDPTMTFIYCMDCSQDDLNHFSEHLAWDTTDELEYRRYRMKTCLWCGIPMFYMYHNSMYSDSEVCSQYCTIRRSRHGGQNRHRRYSDTPRQESVDPKSLCHHCGSEFLGKRKDAKYCQPKCRVNANRAKSYWVMRNLRHPAPTMFGPSFGIDILSEKFTTQEAINIHYEKKSAGDSDGNFDNCGYYSIQEYDKATNDPVGDPVVHIRPDGMDPKVPEEPEKEPYDPDKKVELTYPTINRVFIALQRLSIHCDLSSGDLMNKLIINYEDTVLASLSEEEISAYKEAVPEE